MKFYLSIFGLISMAIAAESNKNALITRHCRHHLPLFINGALMNEIELDPLLFKNGNGTNRNVNAIVANP
jgi:hypothetical protein